MADKTKLTKRLFDALTHDFGQLGAAGAGAGIGAAAGALSNPDGDRGVGAFRGAVAGGLLGGVTSHVLKGRLNSIREHAERFDDLSNKTGDLGETILGMDSSIKKMRGGVESSIEKMRGRMWKSPSEMGRLADAERGLADAERGLTDAQRSLAALTEQETILGDHIHAEMKKHHFDIAAGGAPVPKDSRFIARPLALGGLAGAAGYGYVKYDGPQNFKENTKDIRMAKMANENFWIGFEKRAAPGGFFRTLGNITGARQLKAGLGQAYHEVANKGATVQGGLLHTRPGITNRLAAANRNMAVGGAKMLGTTAVVGTAAYGANKLMSSPQQPQQQVTVNR